MSANQNETLYFQTSVNEFFQGEMDGSSSLFLPSEEMNLEHPIIFDSSNNLEQDEWFFINLFSKNEGRKIINMYRNVIDNPLNTITKNNHTKIKSIFKEERKNKKLFFQRIYPKQRMNNRSVLMMEQDELEIRDINGLTVEKKQTDAVLDFSNGHLYFKKFGTIKAIFKGIEAFYRIATDAEIENFKAIKILSFSKDFEIKDRNKKSIAHLIGEKLLEDEHPFKDWKEYADSYDQNIKTEKGKFVISSNPELTTILKILSESFYKGEVTGQKKEASL